MSLGLLSALVLAAAPQPTAELPSVAVLPLESKTGVSKDAADMLTSNLAFTMRKTKRFSRVVDPRDLQALLGFERQKQLLSCESSSCMAEAAGALGVDYVLNGSLGRLGETWLFNASLLNARTAQLESTVSKPIKGKGEDALLNAVDDIVNAILAEASLGLPTTTAAPAPAPAPAPKPEPKPEPKPDPQPAPGAVEPTTSPTPTPAATATPAGEGGGGNPAAMGIRVVGGVGVALAAVVLVAGLLGGAAGMGTAGVGLVAGRAVRVPFGGIVLPASFLAGLGALGLGVVTSVLVGIVGGGALAGSFIIG
jgi:TolB-like protein